MKKLFLLLIIAVCVFSITIKVEAKPIETYQKFDNKVTINYLEGQGDYANCDGLLTSDAIDMIKELLGYFRLLAPVVLIVMVALDFAQAVISQDDSALKKAQGKVVPRTIAAVALFFIPTMIRAILNLDGVRSAIEIPNDPLCGTMNSPITEIIEME